MQGDETALRILWDREWETPIVRSFSPWIRVLLLKLALGAQIMRSPQERVFEFVVHSWEDIPIWRAAAAEASLATGKRIVLIYPAAVTVIKSDEENERLGDENESESG